MKIFRQGRGGRLWAATLLLAGASFVLLCGGAAQANASEAVNGEGMEAESPSVERAPIGLLTNYTSFLAIDERVRGKQAPQGVDQPLPLPESVGKHAVGGVMAGAVVPSTPEPALGAAGGLMLAMLLYTLRARRRSAVSSFLSQ